nr:DUF4229 domain-containing protein [Kineosporia mesophila]
MRLAIFVVVLIVLDLFMDPSVVWIALAAGISLALSYLLLSRPREQLTEAIVERTQRRLDTKHEGLDRSDAEIEDEADEAARARGEQP